MNVFKKVRVWIDTLVDSVLQPAWPNYVSAELAPGDIEPADPELDANEADALDEVVNTCYMGGVTVASNFARIHAAELAMAASRGLITTLQFDGNYGRMWRPTFDGYLWVQSGKHQDV